MMRFLNLLLASVLSGSALADLTFDIMAVSQGKEIDWKAAGLEIVPIPQRSRFHHHEGNSTAAAGQHPHQKRASTSGNWCGISQKVQSNRDTLSSVYGYFQAPNLSFRPGYPYPQWASAWIGMDGGTCNSALLQSGVTVVLNSNGQQSASAWFEWAPRASYSISGFPVHVGDWLFVNITATSATSGIVNIANLAQSLAMTININDGPTLCRQDADWIVEDFYDAKGQVAFGRFQDVWFEDVGATTTKGQKIDLKNASPISLSNGTAISCVANVFDDNNFWCASQG